MKIFFSVGEPSGDLHGANLILRLQKQQPALEIVGYGGPRMAAVGCRLHSDLTQLAVMGLSHVLFNLSRFWSLVCQADRYFRHHRPDAVVLIDYPGFNWWIARRAKIHGIPVFYYGTPQIWAWAGWRVHKMRRLVDHILCKLPFEPEWYRQRGCNATFVGHPYFDQLREERLDETLIAELTNRPGPLVTILPGSRTQEVKNNLKWFLKAAQRILEEVPQTRFAIAIFKQSQAKIAQSLIARLDFPVDVVVGQTPELIRASHCTMACSGSVSLELLYHEKPTVILYWATWWFYGLVKLFAPLLQFKVKYITLVNMLADEPLVERSRYIDTDRSGAEDIPFPEYATYGDKSAQIARHLIRWLSDEQEWKRRRAHLHQLRKQIACGGASERAATYILRQLENHTDHVPQPHFSPSAHAKPSGVTLLADTISRC